MVAEDRDQVQRVKKVTLKRKLTGPPKLLLGNTRTRSMGKDRTEARTNKDKMDDSEIDTAELTETTNMDKEVSSEVTAKSSRGRCAAEDDDARNRKVNRRRWWRRLSPAVVCIRRQKKDKQSLERQRCEGSAPPEGELQETDAAAQNDTEENSEQVTTKKRTSDAGTFKRFLTLSKVRKTQSTSVETDGHKPSAFRKKLQSFFTRGGSSAAVPLEDMEDTLQCEEALPAAQEDKPAELRHDVTTGSPGVVTVAAEMSIHVTEEQDGTPTEESPVYDIRTTKEDLDSVDRSETIPTSGETAEGQTEFLSSKRHQVFCDSTRVVLDSEDLPPPETTSNQDASETSASTSQSLRPLSNGPLIRIELVPPDDEEYEEEECWEGSSSSENHLLLLLSFEHSERQLVEVARSLVRAAMNAAVDQLTREQQSESHSVHRESQGCRDHA